MKHLKMLACTFVAAVASNAPSAAGDIVDPLIGKYVSYEVEDFTIITSRSSDQARQFIEDLAKFRVTLEKTLGKRAQQNLVPTRIIIVSSSVWEKYLAPRQNVTGWFHPGPFGNVMVMNGDAIRGAALYVIFHEYTHFYLASQFAGVYPPWFNEGLAELMALAKFDDSGATMQVLLSRVQEARDGDWIPFERLIRVDHNSPEYQSHKLANSFYSQAWLTVHYGMVENREFGKQMFEYLGQLNSLRPHDEAARIAFGPDLAAIDQQLREYSRNTRMASGRISLGELPAVTLPPGKPVAVTDAQATILELMFAHRFPPDRIRPFLVLLARNEPKSARPAIFAARLAHAEDDDALFVRMIAEAESRLAPADVGLRRDLASVLLGSAMDLSPMSKRTTEDTERDLKRAMRLYGEVIAQDNSDVEALWGFGTAALRLDRNLDLAEQALLAAYELAPVSADIATSLADLKGRQQQPEAMIPYLKDAARHANDLQTKKWATDRLAEMEKWVVERDKVDAENRQQREKYEKELAEYEKKYGKVKKKPAG
jgi:tetratricopeptide (TPR) repeat protein